MHGRMLPENTYFVLLYNHLFLFFLPITQKLICELNKRVHTSATNMQATNNLRRKKKDKRCIFNVKFIKCLLRKMLPSMNL